jgi:hypothetical protein
VDLKTTMAKQLKTAPELERLILVAMRRHGVCAGVAAVTVREAFDTPGTNWEVFHINAPGGHIPAPCRDACATAVTALREEFDLLPEFAWGMDF